MKKAAPFLAPFAAALLLALALAACSGGAATPEATSTPAPTAAATPEATSTPAPTATATPEATPTPEAASTLTPEQACANGVAVSEPEAHPGLVADCEALLRAKDALRGDASLDWGGGLAVADWEGVAVSGEPPRVTGLDLRGKWLTGSIPRELRRLRLSEVRLGGNALTGCVPSAFEDASGDAASLGLPWCLRYDRLDATGEVASAGEWAILDGSGVLATWEQLRSEAATLRVHQTDAGGTSWASEFGAVAVNDLFEWRLADDCWVRYRVTDAPVAPSGASGRWEFPVEWMTYAATGSGCKGAVGAGTVLSADEAAPTVIASRTAGARIITAITTPIRFGPYLLIPTGWTGALEEFVHVGIPAPASGVAGRSASALPTWPSENIAEVRRHPLWRDPVLPTGWVLHAAKAHGDHSLTAWYGDEESLVAITMGQYKNRPWRRTTPGGPESNIWEARVIDGHMAIVWYDPRNAASDLNMVEIFDGATEVEYRVIGYAGSVLDTTISIARSLYQPTAP